MFKIVLSYDFEFSWYLATRSLQRIALHKLLAVCFRLSIDTSSSIVGLSPRKCADENFRSDSDGDR